MLLHAGFLLDPDDGRDMFLRKSWLWRDYMVLYPRRQNYSRHYCLLGYEFTGLPVHIEIRVKDRKQYYEIIPMLLTFDRAFFGYYGLRVLVRFGSQTRFSQHLRRNTMRDILKFKCIYTHLTRGHTECCNSSGISRSPVASFAGAIFLLSYCCPHS
jgi:hypothetical protein